MEYRVFVAGTFDSLHAGHRALLEAAFSQKKPVVIGITTDSFVQKFKPGVSNIRPLAVRQKELTDWIAQEGYTKQSEIMVIEDPYEPAASMPDLDTIVVTPDNKGRGEEINARRKEKKLTPLGLLVVDLVPAQDQTPISSTRVREGEIDMDGRLIMPDSLRPELQEPLGRVLVGDSIGSSIEQYRTGIVITVGDITTETLLLAGIVPHLAIVDFFVGRQPHPALDARFNELKLYRVPVKSGPGFIAAEAVQMIQKWATHPADKVALVVTGEEDLLTLPAVAWAPLNSIVYYGQPDKGLVEVVINPDKQKQARELLSRFV